MMRTKPEQNPTRNTIRSCTLALLFTALLALIACKTATPPPTRIGNSTATIDEGVPGGVFVDTVTVSARVTAIDKNRNVTLMGSDKKKFTTKVGPDVVNFDLVQVGDLLSVTLVKETVVFIAKEGTDVPEDTVALIARSEKGKKPAGVVAAASQITATIKSIDRTNRTVTLKVEDGSVETLPVRDDIDMSKHKVGEKVVFQVTEMLALSVDKENN